MSTVRTLALGALMVFGVAGVSAAQSSATPKPRADGARPEGQFRRGPGGGREGRGFGRDLNLTDAQKAQMKAIRQKYQPQNQALNDRAKPFMEAARTARQKGDTVAARTNMEKARQVMQSGQSFRAQEQAEIRAILTPEQQAKFDARAKVAAERRAKGGKKGWGHKRAAAPPAVKQ
jgi:Spy/CpxP family protein refolding chaperone